MNQPVMTQTQAVLERIDSPNQLAERTVTFVLAHEGGETPGLVQRTVLLSFDDWKSMGEPDKLTVTIQAGDTLNTEETP